MHLHCFWLCVVIPVRRVCFGSVIFVVCCVVLCAFVLLCAARRALLFLCDGCVLRCVYSVICIARYCVLCDDIVLCCCLLCWYVCALWYVFDCGGVRCRRLFVRMLDVVLCLWVLCCVVCCESLVVVMRVVCGVALHFCIVLRLLCSMRL